MPLIKETLKKCSKCGQEKKLDDFGLHKRCNNQKSAKHPVDYMQQKGFLL